MAKLKNLMGFYGKVEMGLSEWETILPDVLHATRSLLCTVTDTTHHMKDYLISAGNQQQENLFLHG